MKRLTSVRRRLTLLATAVLVAAAFAIGIGVRPLPAIATESCEPITIGLGPEKANAVAAAYFGRSVAQVFAATDTLIRAITVWRQPDPHVNEVPMRLFIGNLVPGDSTRPAPQLVLLSGPAMVLYGTSKTARPVRFELDPPHALPGPGRYFFAVKEDICAAQFGVLADSSRGYGGGDAWLVMPAAGCANLGNNTQYEGLDLIFEIEFCAPTVSAVERSWGSVKAWYR